MLPLAGITVISLEQAVAAPFATRQLADLGARVIKVERPGAGDFARDYDRSVHGTPATSCGSTAVRRGSSSTSRTPATGRCSTPSSARPTWSCRTSPPARSTGSAWTRRLCALASRLVHCSISGYGREGPYRAKKAYDLLVQCETGLVRVTGTPEAPSKAGVSVADISTGMYAYSGILTALLQRASAGGRGDGRGGDVDALGEWTVQPAFHAAYGGSDPPDDREAPVDLAVRPVSGR